MWFQGPLGVTLWSLMNPLFVCVKNLVKLGVPTALQQAAWNVWNAFGPFLIAAFRKVNNSCRNDRGCAHRGDYLPSDLCLNMASAVLTGNRLGTGDVAGARSEQGDRNALPGNYTLARDNYIYFRSQISGLLTKIRSAC